ncbi:MAG TPA: hypothetical protein VFS18_01270 [Actinomycetota bacterium]|nr:hypothetical protein [Actinomycetota bacterium]
MIYLVIMVVAATAGIASLWVQQRRERAHLTSVDDFRSSLERISARPVRFAGHQGPRRRPQQPRRRTDAAPPVRRASASGARGSHAAGGGMDPQRRAAAKRRIEARRRARSRTAI